MADNDAQIATLTTTIADLKTSIYSGVLRARINERDTTFRSLAEMKEALRLAEADLVSLQPPMSAPRRVRQVRFMTSSGF